MSGYAAPPLETSGSEGFIAAGDIIVEEAAVVVLVDHHVSLLVELMVGEAGVFQFVQVAPIVRIPSRGEGDLLHEVIVPASLAFVSPCGGPCVHWHLHGYLSRASRYCLDGVQLWLMDCLSVYQGRSRWHGSQVLWPGSQVLWEAVLCTYSLLATLCLVSWLWGRW